MSAHHWLQHGIHSSPLRDELPLLREVAHAAWHMLDEGGEHPHDEGLHVVSAADWRHLSDALDAAGWSADAASNARTTGERMVSTDRQPQPCLTRRLGAVCQGTLLPVTDRQWRCTEGHTMWGTAWVMRSEPWPADRLTLRRRLRRWWHDRVRHSGRTRTQEDQG